MLQTGCGPCQWLTMTGRAWTIGELRNQDWDALHQLWWVCVKERNRLATEKIERARLDAGYGDQENKDRDTVVQETMKAILDTLSERHQAYVEAVELAKQDPSIDLSRTDGPQFVEPAYVCTHYVTGWDHANIFLRTLLNQTSPTLRATFDRSDSYHSVRLSGPAGRCHLQGGGMHTGGGALPTSESAIFGCLRAYSHCTVHCKVQVKREISRGTDTCTIPCASSYSSCCRCTMRNICMHRHIVYLRMP